MPEFVIALASRNTTQQKFQKGQDHDFTEGLVKDRGCTDILCLLFFLFTFVIYIILSFVGAQHGNPTRLYKQRDFRGAFCGTGTNWNNGPNLDAFPALSQTMNLSNVVDSIAKQFLCSPDVEVMMTRGSGGLPPLLTTQRARDEYLCGCCLSPCEACRGSLDVPDAGGSSGWSAITSRMGSLTNPLAAAELFNPAGPNGDLLSSVWSETEKYFTPVCLPDCTTDFTAITTSSTRKVTYMPDRDSPLWFPWQVLINSTSSMTASMHQVVQDSFKFQALPESVCPYPAAYCVPMPGVNFEEKAGSVCSFKMSEDVVNSVGSAAAEAFVSLSLQGDGEDGEDTSQTIGDWMGDFETSLDVFVIVAFTAFILGFVYLILARFFMKICVWMAAFATVLIFPLGGALANVRSFQCADASMFDIGKGVAVSIAVAGRAATELFDPANESSWQFASETSTGDGADYRGVQRYTVSGRSCQDWDSESPHEPKYNSTTLPDAGLKGAFCRNPYREGDLIRAPTIWCYTTDESLRWELCSPVGVFKPVCLSGYAVADKNDRKALEYVSYFLFGFGAVWFIIVILMKRRIDLAIAINEVGAQFVSHTPQVVFVPIVNALVSGLWTGVWFFLAAFLLSQVPDGYTPKGFYSTYVEAMGNYTTPGACNDKWPAGFAWKAQDCEISHADGYEVAKCWRCYPPRYIMDARFAFAFFFFLWVNALKVAIGDTSIAGAVGIWFFSAEKGFGRGRLTQSAWNVFRYHLGSLCFGSFVIAVIQFARYMMKYMEKQAHASKNYIMVWVSRVLQCFMWCFEKFVKFLSRKAYIQIALTGQNFCWSAQKAFFLIMRNAIRFATVGIVGQFVETIGVAFITLSSMTVGYLSLKAIHPEVFPVVPMITFFCISVMMAKMFMGVFGVAASASLQCFLIVEEMEMPTQYIPKQLRYALRKAKKAERGSKDRDGNSIATEGSAHSDIESRHGSAVTSGRRTEASTARRTEPSSATTRATGRTTKQMDTE